MAMASSFTAPREQSRARLVAYWITTILGPASFVMGGTMMLLGNPQMLANLKAVGLPPYFGTILGCWQLAGVVAVLVPRFPLVKEWAYAGFVFMLTGASAMHLLAGDGIARASQPLPFLALVVASWALRPQSRRLDSRSG